MSEKTKASAEVTVTNKSGLHARPASLFVQKAARHKSDIDVLFDEKRINAKSIMGILSAGISKDSVIVIEAEGEDAQEAVDDLVKLIEEKFGEED